MLYGSFGLRKCKFPNKESKSRSNVQTELKHENIKNNNPQ